MHSSISHTRRGFLSASKEEIIVDDTSFKNLATPPKLLIPMSDHPIFPGYSNLLSITEQQYTKLRDVDEVFTSVITDEKIAND